MDPGSCIYCIWYFFCAILLLISVSESTHSFIRFGKCCNANVSELLSDFEQEIEHPYSKTVNLLQHMQFYIGFSVKHFISKECTQIHSICSARRVLYRSQVLCWKGNIFGRVIYVGLLLTRVICRSSEGKVLNFSL